MSTDWSNAPHPILVAQHLERASRADWITIAAALAGMALFFKDSLTLGHLDGDLLGALSGVFFAGMTVIPFSTAPKN